MPSMNRRRVLGSSLAGLAGAAALAKLAHAGPLSPPAGLVRSTGRSMEQIEPRTPVTAENCPGDQTCVLLISTPGAYCVVGNLTATDARPLIRIACSGVTLDCRGMSLNGLPPGTPVTCAAAITVDDGCTNVDIFDCVCKYFIHAIHAGRACVTVSDLDCDGCTTGVEVGPGSEVSECRCLNCPGAGFSCPDDLPPAGSTRGACFSECDAFSCGSGFACGTNCCCCECRAHSCVTGFACTSGGDCDDCDAIACTTGFSAGDGFCCDSCRAITCPTGFSCGADFCSDCCECLSCDSGITAGPRAWITNTCVVRSSNVSSTGVAAAGITVGDDSDCDECCVDNPTGHGFVTGSSCSLYCCCTCRCASGFYGAQCSDGCDVCECTFTDNWGAISCGNRCTVLDNVCVVVAAGAGGGPHVRLGSHCRCEDNSCDNAPIGVQLAGGATGTMVCSNSFHACPVPVEFVQASSNAVAAITTVTNGWGGGVSSHSNVVH